MGITAKELRKSLSPDVAELSAAALATLDTPTVAPAELAMAQTAMGGTEQFVPNPLAMRFEALWERWGGPALECEYKFSAARRWRADYCHTASRTIIELEGGIYSAGRHTRAAGYLGDIEKYNAAAAMGWRIIRCQPKELCTMATLQLVRQTLFTKAA
jgi:very-short-patch-repair endonuclease